MEKQRKTALLGCTGNRQFFILYHNKGDTMNTIENLLDNGIEIKTAKNMLKTYSEKIGTRSGVYVITDISYDFDRRSKDVTLCCTECGNVIHRYMTNGKNKWSELIKTCACQKKRKEENKESVLKNSEKIKKGIIVSRVGEIFGDFEIISVDDLEENPKYTIRCVECGYEKVVSAKSGNFERRKNFDCTKHYTQKIKFDESYVGKKNNRLTVLKISRINNKKVFECMCDCGNVKYVEPNFWEDGSVKSCGCLKKDLTIPHSKELDRLRRIHGGMKQRCYNQKSAAYGNYGGRGISICEEWHDREKFIDWALSNGYRNDLSIDRINVNGKYEPSNWRSAGWETQYQNRRPRSEWKKQEKKNKKTWTVDGETMEREYWCEKYDIGLPTVMYRINHKGMTVEQALKTPKLPGRPRKEK